MNSSPPSAGQGRALRPATVAAAYAAAAVLWILLSDRLVAAVSTDAAHLTLLQTYKGWGFVALTTALLFLALRHGRRGEDALYARLQQQARQYRALFESNPHPMWVCDIDSHALLAVNGAAVAHYGYSRDEFLAMSMDQLRLPNGATDLERHRRKNGDPIEVEISSHALEFEGRSARIILAHDVTAQRAAQHQVAEAEERLRLALAAANQGLYDLNVQTGAALINDAYATMLGYAPGELVESNAAWLARLHPEDRERVGRVYADYVAGKLPEYRVEFRQRTKQGEWKWILSLGKLMARDAAGAPLRMLGTHTDIDADKQAEARIRRLTNLYAALSQCNQAIVRIRDRSQLLREICRVAVDYGGLRMAWIGELRDGRVVAVASFGARTDYVDSADISLDASVATGRGPTARALREGCHVVCDDIESDPIMAPWRERVLDCGFHASAAFPLRCCGETVGVLNLYAPVARFFDADLVDLLDEMALDISFALDRFRLEAARDTAERRFRTLVEQAADSIFVADVDGRIVDVNACACATLGYGREELVGMNVTDLDPTAAGLGVEEVRRIHRAALEQGQLYFGQHRRKDGTTFPVEVRIAGMRLPEGDFVIGLARDVTQRQQAERVLRDSEHLFRHISQASTDIAYSCHTGADGSFEIDWMVGAAERITGYSLEELIARRCWRCLVVDEDQEAFRNHVIGLAPGSSGACELRLRRKDGAIVWVGSSAECVGDAERPGAHRLYGGLVDISGRKHAEAERERLLADAQAARLRFQELMERITDGFVALDRDWRYVFINGRGAQMLGRRPEDLLGRHIWTEFPEGIGQPFQRAYEQAMAQQCALTVEEHYSPWGRWFENHIYPSPQGLTILFRDVSASKRAEQALRDSQTLLEQAQRVARLGSWRYDLHSGKQQWSDEVFRLFGLAPGSFEPDHERFLNLVDAADQPRLRDIERRALAGEACDGVDYSVTLPDGGQRILHAEVAVSRDGNGLVSGLFGTVQDVTERRLAEQALRESEARLRRVVDEMPVLFDAFDEQGGVIHWNRECERVTGYTAAELVGNPAAMELLYPDTAYRERMLALWRERGHDYRNWEWTLTAKDGGIRHIAWSNISGAVPIPGWPVWGVGVDLTARREVEATLAHYAERLQSLSRRLLSVQEEERRALARELHDEIGQQLTALKLNLTVLLRGAGAALDTRRLTDCVDIADLTIERIRDTALNLRPSVLDDLGLTSALHWYARRQAERAGCRIDVRATLPPLPTEVETALFRIVQEAVNNAIRHGRAGHVDIMVDRVENRVRLAVEDDGGGFDIAGGKALAGMGLFSMRERAELLGGSFALRSNPGGGTRVQADIPMDLTTK